MLENLCFDFSLFGTLEVAYSLDDYILLVDRCDGFKGSPFHKKIARDISSGITYLNAKGIAHRDLKPANILVSNKHYSGLDSNQEQRTIPKPQASFFRWSLRLPSSLETSDQMQISAKRETHTQHVSGISGHHFLPQCRAIPLKVSQTTAVAQYDHSAILEGTEFKEPQQIFLCLLIFDHLYGDKNSPLSEDCWRKTTASVEDIIVSSPGNFNHLGDLYKFYDASEANQLLRNGASIRNLDFILCRVGMH